MQITLAIIAAVAAILGLLYANIVRRRGQQASPAGLRWLVVLTIAVVLLLFALTLPSSPPFAAGAHLGWGFLLGAALGLYALYEALGSWEDEYGSARLVGLLSAAVLGPSLLLIVFRGDPTDALLGCALGAVLVAGVLGSSLRPLFATVPAGQLSAACFRAPEVYALAVTAVVAGMRLGIDHFPRLEHDTLAGGYWAFPALALAASALVVVLIAGAGRKPAGWSTLITGLLAGAALVIFTAALDVRLLPKLVWWLPLYGLLAFALPLSALLREERADTDARPVSLAFGLVLVVVVVMVLAFLGLRGYGVALALLAALPLVAAVYLCARRDQEPLAEALGVGGFTALALLALYRLFIERAGHGWTLNFQQHYDMIAVLLGAAAGFGLLAFFARGYAVAGGRLKTALPVRGLLLGVLLAAVPVALTALWGVRSAGAFLVGLVISEATWMLLAAWSGGVERARVLAAAPHIYLLGSALAAVQFAPLVPPELSTTTRLIILGGITAIILVWVLVDALLAARTTEAAR